MIGRVAAQAIREAEGDLIEVQGGAQLGVSLRRVSKEKAVVIDINFKGQAVSLESMAQEVEVGQ
jgi:hypothetical protein